MFSFLLLFSFGISHLVTWVLHERTMEGLDLQCPLAIDLATGVFSEKNNVFSRLFGSEKNHPPGNLTPALTHQHFSNNRLVRQAQKNFHTFCWRGPAKPHPEVFTRQREKSCKKRRVWTPTCASPQENKARWHFFFPWFPWTIQTDPKCQETLQVICLFSLPLTYEG